jgi:transcriptional regulator with XRE-family HTH domain
LKSHERHSARQLRQKGYSINQIVKELGVAKSSVSIWVRDITLTEPQSLELAKNSHSALAVERRRTSRLLNEQTKREKLIEAAALEIKPITDEQLWLMGTMLYWAEGGKTQRMVRFSNGDPEMIKIMMEYFRRICAVPEHKFRGYIHIHPHLDYRGAERYWASITAIPLAQFFKTYRKPNKSSQNKKNSLPHGVLDIYVLDTKLFYKICGWSQGIFSSY